MVAKRDVELEDDEEEKSEGKDYLLMYTGAGFLILSTLFFYFLSVKTEAEFSYVQILFGIMSSTIIVFFLLWIRYIMRSNRYLAISISVLAIGAVSYALTRKYQGIYTTMFLLLGILLALGYTAIKFVKYSKN